MNKFVVKEKSKNKFEECKYIINIIIKDNLNSKIEKNKKYSVEEQKQIMILRRQILLMDHDMKKITKKLKSIQKNETQERININQMSSNNNKTIQEIKKQILDLKNDIRRKEEYLGIEQKKMIEVPSNF